MRIPENQLRVRYPKGINSLYTEDFEKRRKCIGGKTEMFNRDKEKEFYKADSIPVKTGAIPTKTDSNKFEMLMKISTKQMDYTGEQVPYERVTKKRPVTSYGPFISSTSYGNTFQGWDASGSYAPPLVPKGNLQVTSNIPFRASSAYRDTFKSAPASRSGSNGGEGNSENGGAGGGKGSKTGGRRGASGAKNIKDPAQVFGGKNRNQRSQISILSSPGKNTNFTKDTTYRKQFKGQRQLVISKPIRHPDNLGNLDQKGDRTAFRTSYRSNFNDFGNSGNCKREDERVSVRKGLKQLQ